MHLLLALTAVPSAAKDILTEIAVTHDAVVKILQELRGSQRITDPEPEAKFNVLEKYARNLTKMARRMQCSIFVKNAPTIYGLGMGEGYATMSIGTPTGDGLTKASHFVRPLQCSLVGYFRIA